MLAITTGIVVAYLSDYALSGIHGWRCMFGLAAIPSIILTVAMWKLPDSPRFDRKVKGGTGPAGSAACTDRIRRKRGNRRHPKEYGNTGCRRDDRIVRAFTPDALDCRSGTGSISADNRHQHRHLLRPDHFQICRHYGHRTGDPRRSGVGHGDVVLCSRSLCWTASVEDLCY
jgi:hypothetical protein